MHNSKNSAYRKDIFTSTLLAQAKLLGISADFNNLDDLNNKIDADTKSKVSTLPSFFEAGVQNINAPVQLQEYLRHKSFDLRSKLDAFEISLLDKAYEYGMILELDDGQDITDYDFKSLEDDIYEWEKLLSKSNRLGISWDISEYDVVALEQEIEYGERSEWNTSNSLYGSFYSNLGA